MVLKILRISDVLGMRILTDSGEHVGVIEEANLVENKVDSWRVKISRDSNLTSVLGGARGLIIPHQYVKAISEVVIINRNSIPTHEETQELEEE